MRIKALFEFNPSLEFTYVDGSLFQKLAASFKKCNIETEVSLQKP